MTGERKRQLTAAVLSDNHGKEKKGKKSKEGEGDIGEIGRILQKALQRSALNQLEKSKEEGTSSGVTVVESTYATAIN